ncbi:glycosyltransferase family protein [Luteimonas dalianensis]|uniref:glycosyltransferase family protein n=1 Tax=Luteimonas dalianensis TaxID=1148196 RepID=UPI003BF15084
MSAPPRRLPDDDHDADLRLRLELLRCRARLDRVQALLGPSEGREAGAAGTPADAAAAIAALLDDRRELARLKGSLRYRLASLMVDAMVPVAGASVTARRLASGGARSGRRVLGRLRRGVRARVPGGGQASAPPEAEIHALPAPGAMPADAGGFRIAAVLDPFSAEGFAPECSLCLLTPADWVEQVRRHRPHLLLVESAWTGLDGEWKGQVERAPAVLRSLVASCREAGIRTVFWNKEDPLHFGAFLETARLFDQVLTTDADCVPRYRRLLGHDRVAVMPFAVQPAIHHPVGLGQRNGSSVFAGAWYGRLPQRCRDFTRCADALALAGPLVIHDRQDGRGAGYQRFPARYAGSLRPAVPYAQTGALFRGHVIGLTLNTIKGSPTMFARRALELAACGTSVYSNHSLALHGFLGDGAVISDDPERLLTEAWSELRQPSSRSCRMRRLRALRAVLGEHTWARRTHDLARKALGVELHRAADAIGVVARVADEAELGRVCGAFRRQVLAGAQLWIDAPPGLSLPAYASRLGEDGPGAARWVALLHPGDYYGPHYLSDLVAATQWRLGDIIGKGAWHAWTGEDLREHDADREYRLVESLPLRRAMFRADAVAGPVTSLLDRLETGELAGRCVSTDAWEYVQGGAGVEACAAVSARCSSTPAMRDVDSAVSRLPAQPDPAGAGAKAIDGVALAGLFAGGRTDPRVSCAALSGRMELCSLLEHDQAATVSTRGLPLDTLRVDGALQACLQAPWMASVRFHLEVLGRRGQVLQRVRMHPSVMVRVAAGALAASCRFTAEVRGPVVQEIDGIWASQVPASPALVPGRGRLALVTNGYPKAGSLYRNGFVHRRVMAYRERGIGVDVFVVRSGSAASDYEFEGVLVRECDPGTLAATLAGSGHAAIAVHFLDAPVWEALQGVVGRQPITVWLHGSEIQSWRHREFNHATAAGREAARQAGEGLAAFWRQVFARDWPQVHFVFVSRFFAEQTWEDLGLRPSAGAWSVIHNPIDTGLFRYRVKPPALARNILSIRPHASRIYANDLVAAAIHALAGHELFPSLAFTLVGDGGLWDEDFHGLDRYPNVTLVRGFLPQREIASLHRAHGTFLVPTRGDTQGVSRDEAMSSGLVPVTTRVAAVPEFVDGSCAEVCEPEDAAGLAAAVVRLATDGARYQAMSRRAAERVVRQSGGDIIIDRELAALGLAAANASGCCAPMTATGRVY